MAVTSIEWTNQVWNPSTGCDKVSPGCKFCYALPISERLETMERQPKYKNGFDFSLHPETYEDPLHWKKPSRIFVKAVRRFIYPILTENRLDHSRGDHESALFVLSHRSCSFLTGLPTHHAAYVHLHVPAIPSGSTNSPSIAATAQAGGLVR